MADKCTGDGLERWDQTSAPFPSAVPQTCFSTDLQVSDPHNLAVWGTRPKDPSRAKTFPRKAKTPDLLRTLSLMMRGRHVLQSLAGIHAVLGSPKTHIPTSTNGGW